MALNMSSLFLSFLPQIFVVCSQIESSMKMRKKETKEKKEEDVDVCYKWFLLPAPDNFNYLAESARRWSFGCQED